MIIRTTCLLIALLLPFMGRADGQGFLIVVSDAIDFIGIFIIWALLVFPAIFLLNKFREKKLRRSTKLILLLTTGAIALFTWFMVKHDSHPYEGPIDSMLHKDLIEEHRKADSINLYQGYADSTITETIAHMDTSKVGIYIWLNHKEVFVRKNTAHLGSQAEEDALTMATVRRWKK
jgi:energy-coupling factor transporter transmembrane protein EcfT